MPCNVFDDAMAQKSRDWVTVHQSKKPDLFLRSGSRREEGIRALSKVEGV
jgi:hypothetical protein